MYESIRKDTVGKETRNNFVHLINEPSQEDVNISRCFPSNMEPFIKFHRAQVNLPPNRADYEQEITRACCITNPLQ